MQAADLNTQIREIEREIQETSQKLKAQKKMRRNLLKAIECANQAGLNIFDQGSPGRPQDDVSDL